MYLLNEMVDRALPEKFTDKSLHRIVFRNLVIGNPKIRTMETVERTGRWIATLTEKQVKRITYADFEKAVGDDGGYYNHA